ncbi:hypothetical protein [Dactylosporangium sp. CA-139066]|uniref:hypothetical protein n=1 Tax=Dactylosporangium sp. CA-139066 TaxID=3239930 RepID=UPI003D90CAB0
MLTFVGVATGLILATTVCSRAARWVLGAMSARPANAGTVERLDVHRVGGRQADVRYTVRVSWPAFRGGRRDYRFDGTGPADFPRRCATGETVGVLYPRGRPHRFVIDLPYAAGMTDQFS